LTVKRSRAKGRKARAASSGKRGKAGPNATAEGEPALFRHSHSPRLEFWTGMAVALLLTIVNLWIEDSRFGAGLRGYTYGEVHRWLPQHDPEVTVVDTSGIPTERRSDGFEVSSREALLAIVQSLRRVGSAAIGIDIDLASLGNGDLHSDDARFLETLLSITNGTDGGRALPVFVGVERIHPDRAHGWFGDARFDPLAAHLIGKGGDYPTVVTWCKRDPQAQSLAGLSLALYTAAFGPIPREPERFNRFRRLNVEFESNDEHSAAILVDTSAIEQLEHECVRVADVNLPPPSPAICSDSIEKPDLARRLAGRVVILGGADDREARDKRVEIPGSSRSAPGVYLHACGVQTFRNGYLFEVTTLGTIALDLGVAAILFGSIALVRSLAVRRRRLAPRTSVPLAIMILPCLGLLFLGGPLAARYFRIMWDGAPFVAFAVVLHLILEVIVDARHAQAEGHGVVHTDEASTRFLRST
jgi:CHASE2 domain-containing sensor protein